MADTMTLEIVVNDRNATATIKSINRELGNVEKNALKVAQTSGAFDRMRGSVSSVLNPLQLLAGFSLAALSAQIIKLTADFEMTTIGIRTMVGETTKANALLKELESYARTSPFNFNDLAISAKRMLAMGTAADQVLPTIKAIGAAASALGLGNDGINRITLALGQVKAAGRLTGEELRQLTEAGIPAFDLLAQGFGKTTAEIKKAVESGIVPADAAIKILVEGMESKFGSLREASSGALKTNLSNLVDDLEKLGREVGTIISPTLKETLDAVRPVIMDIATAVRDNGTTILDFAKAFGVIGTAIVTYNLAVRLQEVAVALWSVNAATAANPFALAAAALVAFGLVIYQQKRNLDDFWQTQENVVKDSKLINEIQSGKSVEELKKLGYSAEDVKRAMSGAAQAMGDFNFAQTGIRVVNGPAPAKPSFTANPDAAKKAALELHKIEVQTAKEAEEARLGQMSTFGQILGRMNEYIDRLREEHKLTSAIESNIRRRAGYEMFNANAESAKKRQKDDAEAFNKEFESFVKNQDDLTKAAVDKAEERGSILLSMVEQARDRQMEIQRDQIEQAKQIQLLGLEEVSARTIKEKQSLEDAKLAIELDSIRKSEALEIEKINRVRRQTLERLGVGATSAQVGTVNADFDTQIAEAQKRTIDREELLRAKSSANVVKIARDENQKTFDGFKESAGRAFDDVFQKSKSMWQAVGDIFKTTMLTAIREVVSSNIARLLTGMFGGLSGRLEVLIPKGPVPVEVVNQTGGTSKTGSTVGTVGGIAGILSAITSLFRKKTPSEVVASKNDTAKTAIADSVIRIPGDAGSVISATPAEFSNMNRLIDQSGKSITALNEAEMMEIYRKSQHMSPRSVNDLQGLDGIENNYPVWKFDRLYNGSDRTNYFGDFNLGRYAPQIPLPFSPAPVSAMTPPFVAGSTPAAVSKAGAGKSWFGDFFNNSSGVMGSKSAQGIFGQSGKFGKYGGAVQGSLIMGGSMLSMDGWNRGGWGGAAEMAGGGAMIGYAVGGPVGAAVGAAVGFGVGAVKAIFFKSAAEKMKRAVAEVTGVRIDDKTYLKQMVQSAGKTDYKMWVRSQAGQEAVQSYADMTGQRFKSAFYTPQFQMALGGGSVYEAASLYNGAANAAQSSLPGLGFGSLDGLAGTPSSGPSVTILKLDGEATTKIMQGEAVEVINNNPRLISQASTAAMSQNVGRFEAATAASPTAIRG